MRVWFLQKENEKNLLQSWHSFESGSLAIVATVNIPNVSTIEIYYFS